MIEAVEICDVAPRDGFQVIKEPIPTAAKVRVVELLAHAGLTRIETGAFVSPVHVPQVSLQDLQLRLQSCVHARDVWEMEHSEFERLQYKLLEMLKNGVSGEPYETLVDIGEGCFVKGVAKDTSKICIYVGTGIHAQVSIHEALEIIPRRMALLHLRIDEVNAQVANLTQQIHAHLARGALPVGR